jgi:glycerol-3-phosphate dehydrogenase
MTRGDTLQKIRENPTLSVLIIGGGINGAGVFRELALQGIDCLLVDRADFVAGASSNSSRMIHGGVRYLENREFGLVSEALHERDRLLVNAAHYVAPLKTTIPLTSWFGGLLRSALIFIGCSDIRPVERGAAAVRTGLRFYDFFTRNQRLPKHTYTNKENTLREVPGLNPKIVGSATYYDAWISQTERLCIELIQDALKAEPRCAALNYCELCAANNIPKPDAEGGLHVGRIGLKDSLSGEMFSVRPRLIINATGAWIDHTNTMLGAMKNSIDGSMHPTQFIGGTKGSHLVLDNKQLHAALGGANGRMVYYQHSDGRVCIVFPFADKVIAGTTDIRVSDPDSARCDESEIEYILESLRGVFSGISFSREQIVFTYCGVRPLPASDDSRTGTISRDHSLRMAWIRTTPVYCMVGGKLTTFRAFSEQTATEVLDWLKVKRKCSTSGTAIGGGKGFPTDEKWKADWIARLATRGSMSQARAATLLERYGTLAEEIANTATEKSETPLRTLPDYSVGEIERIARDEFVEHLDDIVRRRSTIALLGHAKPEVLAEIAEIAGRVLDWDAARKEEEVRRALPHA